MNTRLSRWWTGVIIVPVCVVGCSSEGSEPSVGDSAEVISEVTSVIDPATGELQATNYAALPSGVRYIDPETGYAEGTTPEEIQKSLSNFVDVWSGSGEEASVNLPTNFLMLGLGARVSDSGVKVITVRAAESLPDGSLSAPVDFSGGVQPWSGLEAYCEADVKNIGGVWYPGVVVGVGGRIDSDDLTSLTIWYRSYDPNPAVRALFGDRIQKNCGSAPGAIERSLKTPENIPDGWVYDWTVVNGIGMRESSNNLTGLRLRFRSVL